MAEWGSGGGGAGAQGGRQGRGAGARGPWLRGSYSPAGGQRCWRGGHARAATRPAQASPQMEANAGVEEARLGHGAAARAEARVRGPLRGSYWPAGGQRCWRGGRARAARPRRLRHKWKQMPDSVGARVRGGCAEPGPVCGRPGCALCWRYAYLLYANLRPPCSCCVCLQPAACALAVCARTRVACACCVYPCCACLCCAPSCWACACAAVVSIVCTLLVNVVDIAGQSSRSCALRSSTSSTSRGVRLDRAAFARHRRRHHGVHVCARLHSHVLN